MFSPVRAVIFRLVARTMAACTSSRRFRRISLSALSSANEMRAPRSSASASARSVRPRVADRPRLPRDRGRETRYLARRPEVDPISLAG